MDDLESEEQDAVDSEEKSVVVQVIPLVIEEREEVLGLEEEEYGEAQWEEKELQAQLD